MAGMGRVVRDPFEASFPHRAASVPATARGADHPYTVGDRVFDLGRSGLSTMLVGGHRSVRNGGMEGVGVDPVTEALHAVLWTYKGWLLYRPFTHLSFALLGPEEAHVGVTWSSRGDTMLWGPCNDMNPFGTRQTHYRTMTLGAVAARDIPVCPRCLYRVLGYTPVYATVD